MVFPHHLGSPICTTACALLDITASRDITDVKIGGRMCGYIVGLTRCPWCEQPAPVAKNPLISMRLPPDLLRRVDAALAAFREAHPGIPVNRADVIKEVLTRHLPPDPGEAVAPQAKSAAAPASPDATHAQPSAKPSRKAGRK